MNFPEWYSGNFRNNYPERSEILEQGSRNFRFMGKNYFGIDPEFRNSETFFIMEMEKYSGSFQHINSHPVNSSINPTCQALPYRKYDLLK